MPYILEAACLCNTGKLRKNNEDNFFFDGQFLEENNDGLIHPLTMTKTLCRECCVAVFDGMGGENFGECASFSASDCMQTVRRELKEYFIPTHKFLNGVCIKLNAAVVSRQKALCTEHMGSTMVALYFFYGYVYACNLGDSRAYQLRDGSFTQLSVDHVEERESGKRRKAPLTQHLGINPEDFFIEPYIVKDRIKHGDQYLLCSDGLTDMLSDFEIETILSKTATAKEAVNKLISAALNNGGRDNVTAIVCKIF